MQFDPLLKDFFKADDGAFSEVTGREVYDSQITLTGHEADLAIDYFGHQNILEGNVKSDPERALKSFVLFPYLTDLKLNFVFPKPGRGELRLYLSQERGFKPSKGDIWFLYRKDKQLCIGSMTPEEWSGIVDAGDVENRFQVAVHKAIIEGKKPDRVKETRKTYRRDPAVSAMSLDKANFQCELDPDHETFTSGRTGKRYVEAHHLVPMKAQADFEQSLDVPSNIYALCPVCHALIHYGQPDLREESVRMLYEKHHTIEQDTGVSLDRVLEYYR